MDVATCVSAGHRKEKTKVRYWESSGAQEQNKKKAKRLFFKFFSEIQEVNITEIRVPSKSTSLIYRKRNARADEKPEIKQKYLSFFW